MNLSNPDLDLTGNSSLTIDQGALYTDLWTQQYYIPAAFRFLMTIIIVEHALSLFSS